MQVFIVLLIWILPTSLLINAYLKMDKEEQQRFKGELRQPLAFIGVGLLIFGLLLAVSGILLDVKWIQHSGAVMVFMSWLMTSIVSWKKEETNFSTSAMLFLLGIIGATIYGYFFFN